jgi:hypothetical protein
VVVGERFQRSPSLSVTNSISANIELSDGAFLRGAEGAAPSKERISTVTDRNAHMATDTVVSRKPVVLI